MFVLRKHQRRLVDKVFDNVKLSVDEVKDELTGKVRTQDLLQTIVVAPWCKGSGKTGTIEYLATNLVFRGYRMMVYVANDDHMKERYLTVKSGLKSAWHHKSSEDEHYFVTSDQGGIAYFVSNETNGEILTRMKPHIHILLIEEGDYVSERSVDDVLKDVPTALVIGSQRGSNNGLLTLLINRQDPRDGISVDVITEDDLLAEGYDRSIHNTLRDIRDHEVMIKEEAAKLSKPVTYEGDAASQTGNRRRSLDSDAERETERDPEAEEDSK